MCRNKVKNIWVGVHNFDLATLTGYMQHKLVVFLIKTKQLNNSNDTFACRLSDIMWLINENNKEQWD